MLLCGGDGGGGGGGVVRFSFKQRTHVRGSVGCLYSWRLSMSACRCLNPLKPMCTSLQPYCHRDKGVTQLNASALKRKSSSLTPTHLLRRSSKRTEISTKKTSENGGWDQTGCLHAHTAPTDDSANAGLSATHTYHAFHRWSLPRMGIHLTKRKFRQVLLPLSMGGWVSECRARVREKEFRFQVIYSSTPKNLRNVPSWPVRL